MKMIDIDEFKRHTRNLAYKAGRESDVKTEAFFNSVLSYVDQYLEIFEKENH